MNTMLIEMVVAMSGMYVGMLAGISCLVAWLSFAIAEVGLRRIATCIGAICSSVSIAAAVYFASLPRPFQDLDIDKMQSVGGGMAGFASLVALVPLVAITWARRRHKPPPLPYDR